MENENLPVHNPIPQAQAEAIAPLEDIEKAHILKALKHFDGNKTLAAEALGITKKTLYNKLHLWGLTEFIRPHAIRF